MLEVRWDRRIVSERLRPLDTDYRRLQTARLPLRTLQSQRLRLSRFSCDSINFRVIQSEKRVHEDQPSVGRVPGSSLGVL